ncbi:MAG: ferrous iron transport protein B [Bacteroidales bacterium]|nr:ferrous iron transport protein B [Bacteroidales bacterium]
MTLYDLQNGEKGVITKVKGRGGFRRRIIEMGFVVGKSVQVIKKAPLRDPIEYSVMGYNVSLRSSEARLIEVIPEKDFRPVKDQLFDGVFHTERANTFRKPGSSINVALVGNPNSGKTTFFNHASGSRERVGNYSGVTVDAKEARYYHKGYQFNITDLPGTYSITAYTPEEIFVRDFITEKMPDVVINIVDGSNLERNMYLTTQLIDMDIRVIMVLNMYDEMQQKGDMLDHESLGKMIGIPVVPAVSSKGKGIKEVFDKIIEVYEDRDEIQRHIHINYGAIVENSISRIQDHIKTKGNEHLTDLVSSRFLAIKLLEEDKEAISTIREHCDNHFDILSEARHEGDKLAKEFGESPESVITDLKYGFISGALKETLKPGESEKRKASEVIDVFLTHKLFGFPIFLFFMWVMFSVTFILGHYPMDWIESGVDGLSGFLDQTMRAGPFKDLLINGIISGVGGVLVFLPNIMILFFFISLMEDTGYMSRAVFIMDKIMHRIGLHGKSFIPLLMGFGCNVPAIMATRTLASRNDRMLTMLINPFISCSARLPIYVLFISAFFVEYRGSMLFLIYGIGVLVAIGTALLFKRTMFRTEEAPFVMELPPYRIPTLRAITLHMWSKAVHYLKKIGGIILVASIIIWALGYFPNGSNYTSQIERKTAEIESEYQDLMAELEVTDTLAIKNLELEKEMALRNMETKLFVDRQENSYIGRLGKTVQPLMAPLGFDWKMTISILSGVAAKEIVVSTLAVLYQVDETVQTHSQSLVEKIQSQTYTAGPRTGEPVFTPLVALAFMLFVLLYFPCIGVIATISKEAGHWKWGLFTVVYTTLIAWLISFLVYQTGSLFF